MSPPKIIPPNLIRKHPSNDKPPPKMRTIAYLLIWFPNYCAILYPPKYL